MVKIVIFSILIFNGFISFGQNMIRGKVIDDKLQFLSGVLVINKSTNVQVYSDQDGSFQLQGRIGDTITIECVGFTTETRVVKVLDSKICVLLMDKSLNCLGSPWSRKQFRKAERQINKRYKDLCKQAEKLMNEYYKEKGD